MVIDPSNMDWICPLGTSEATLHNEWQRKLESTRNKTLDLLVHQIVKLTKSNKKSSELCAKNVYELRSNYHLAVTNGEKLKREVFVEQQQISLLESELVDFHQKHQVFITETKELHQAYLAAKKHYQKDLNIHYSIETTPEGEYVVVVHFFTTTSKQSENGHQQDYMLKLAWQKDSRKSTLLDVKPKPCTFKNLQDRLSETNDIMGLLCSARKYFKKLKSRKVIKKN